MDKPIVKTLVAGAFGGVLFWLISQFTGTPVLANWPGIGQVFALAVLGSGAALVGVYILTASDFKETRTYVFAMLCGMAFQPVLNAGVNFATNLSATQASAAVDQDAEQLRSSARTASTAQVQAAVTSATPNVIRVVNALPGVQDAGKQRELVNSSTAAVSALAVASAKAPNDSVDALSKIAQQSIAVNQGQVTTAAIQSLEQVGTQTKQPEIRSRVSDSLKQLSLLAKRRGLVSHSVLAEQADRKVSGS